MYNRFAFLSYSALAGIFSVIFFFGGAVDTAHAALSWSGGMIQSSITVSSTRMLYNPTQSEFAVSYQSSDGQNIMIATSTSGASWGRHTVKTTVAGPYNGATFFTTTSVAGAAEYYTLGVRIGDSPRGGMSIAGSSNWSDYALTSMAKFSNGQVQINAAGHTFVAGSLDIGATYNVVFASSTEAAASNLFSTSSIAAGVAARPLVDFASFGSHLAAVWTRPDTDTIYVSTSTNGGTTWTSMNFIPEGGALATLSEPRVKFDKNGKLYIVHVSSVSALCTTGCYVYVSSRVGGSWTTEMVDSVGASGSYDPNMKADIAFVGGTTPVILYYDKSTDDVRYAYRDSGNADCDGTAAASWTCGDASLDVLGSPVLSIATNDGYAIAAAMYSYSNGGLRTAYADATPAASSASLGLMPHPVFPKDSKIIIAKNVVMTKVREVSLELSASDASDVAFSTNPDFYGSVWLPFLPGLQYKITLQKTPGKQYVYAKFTNPTGGVSTVVSDDIEYTPDVPVVQTPVVVAPPPPPQPVFSQPSAPVSTPAPTKPLVILDDYLVYNPHEALNSVGGGSSGGAGVVYEQPTCPERPNAFSLGGTIIEDTKTRNLYLILSNKNIVCAVPSRAVAQSWSVYSYPRRSIAGMKVSSTLPYRPGTIVQNSVTREYFFTNTKGKLHKFPSRQQLLALGYGKNRVIVDKPVALNAFARAATLLRNDIHPDGTLFLLDARTKEYAVLQNRALHSLTLKTVQKFKENPARAISALKGEHYPFRERWD